MKTFLLTLVSFMLYANSNAQSFTKQVGGTAATEGKCIEIDATGNIYVSGIFRGTADFNPGAGVFNMTAVGGADFFVLKLNPLGNFLWAKQIGGAGEDYVNDMKLDASGNVYATGLFRGTVDFNPGVGINNLVGQASFNEIFVVTLDALGNYVWAKNMGGAGDDSGQSICVDIAKNVCVTGLFNGTADFDPGAGVFNLVSNGIEEVFISKLDAFGNFVWAKAVGNSGYDYGIGIFADMVGNIYTTGAFSGTVDFDPGVAIQNLSTSSISDKDAFVLKLNAAGEYIWAKKLGGTDVENVVGIVVDGLGNVYTSGSFAGNADFDPGPGLAMLDAFSGVGENVFVSKLNTNGDYVWAKMYGTSFVGESVSKIKLDAANNINLTGFYLSTVDFDPGVGVSNLVSTGFGEIYLLKLSQDGNFLNAKSMGGTAFDQGNSVAFDASDNVYTTGYFGGTADFDPGSGVRSLTVFTTGSDVYINKLNSAFVLPINDLIFTGITSANGNLLQWQTKQPANTTEFVLQISKDGSNFNNVTTIQSSTNNTYSFNHFIKYEDVIFYRLKIQNLDGSFDYSKIIKLNNQQGSIISLSQNPVKDKTILQLNNNVLIGTSVNVIDANGRVVKTVRIKNRYETLDFSQLSSGVYYVQTANGNIIKTLKK